MRSDLRYAFRNLARNPAFAAIVILMLALGIGANTAMFSIIDGVLLRPLAFHDPGQLVAVQEAVPRFGKGGGGFPVNAMHVGWWRERWTSAESIAMIGGAARNLSAVGTGGSEPERVVVGRVSWNLFAMLGVQPQLGRTFLESEDQLGADLKVVLSDALWKRRFQANRDILGTKILVNDVPHEIVGVMPAGLDIPKVSQLQPMAFGTEAADLWKPFGLTEDEKSPMGDFNYGCIARLKPGVTPARAVAELSGIQNNIARDVGEDTHLAAFVIPLQDQITGKAKQGLLLLMLAVGAVLLIVCVNCANLLLSRSSGRAREFSVRLAIGASSGRLLRQMLTESLVISALGGILGLAIASIALRLMLANAPIDIPRINDIGLDARVLTIASMLTIICAIAFGLIPAWRSSRLDPQRGLRSGGRSATENRQSRSLRSVLVSVETALCSMCLIAAGLLLNSFVRVLHVDKGFDTGHVYSMGFNLPDARYPDGPHIADFYRKLLDATRAIPGVSSAAVSSLMPLAGEGMNNLITLDNDPTPVQQRPLADFRMVDEDFFRTLAIPIQQGRSIERTDRNSPVAVISASLAQRVWPGQNALGKRFHLGGSQRPPIEVIGVAGDVRGVNLQTQPNITVYLPFWQRSRNGLSLILRTAADPVGIANAEGIFNAARREIQRLDSSLPVPRLRPMDELVAASVAPRRFQLTLVMLFAATALLLAALGIYGVVSYSVAQRRNEMGIRMALGATGSDLRSLVLRQGLAPVVIGLVVGLAAALALGRVLSGLLFGISATDPLTMSAVTATLLIVAAAACYVPALRATKSDPLVALRDE
jgi:putative ABC transport system permease protein